MKRIFRSPRNKDPTLAVGSIIYILVFNGLLLAGLWTVVLGLVSADRESTIKAAIERNDNTAIAFEQYTIRTLEGADAAIKYLIREYSRLGRKLDVDKFVADYSIDNKVFTGIVLADATGDVRTIAYVEKPTNLVNVADREHFQVHVARDSNELFVGKPVVGRVTGTTVLPLTRRINNPDGSFGGVAMAILEPSRFTDILQFARQRPKDLLSLVGLDGITRARLTGNIPTAGQDVSKSSMFALQLKQENGHYFGSGQIDGIAKYFSYRKLANYRLVVIVGSAQSDVLANFYVRETRNYWWAGIASLVNIVFVGVLIMALTTQRRAAAAIAASQAKYLATFNQAAIGIAHTDADGRYIEVNQRFCAILGYSRDELLKRTFVDVTHPNDLADSIRARKLILASPGTDYSLLNEKRYVRKDGSVVSCLWTACMVRNIVGSDDYLLVIIQDISVPKAAEARARQLAERLASTLEKITDGFVALDSQWRFTFINGQAEHLLGRAANKLLNKCIWDEFPQAISGLFHPQFHRAVETNQPVHFEEFYAPLGLWIDVSAYPSDDGLAIYLRDITEKRHAEKQLRLLGTAVEHLNDVVIITEATPIDPPGPRIVFVNDALLRLTGYSREELIGQSPRMLQGPKTNRVELDRIRSALTNGQPIYSELINYGKDGAQYWLMMDTVPIRDDSDAVTHYVSVQRDITMQKKAEAQIADAKRALLTLSLCNEAMIRAEGERELLVKICEIAVRHGGYRMAFVAYAFQDQAKSIIPQAFAGLEDGYLTGLSLSWSDDAVAGQGPAGVTVRSGEPVVIVDLAIDKGFVPKLEAARKRGYAGVIALPLRNSERVFGVICLFTSEVREIAADEVRLMGELADDLAFGIGTLRTREERRVAQEEVQRLNTDLERRVDERTAELIAANRELESFSYSVSHDLRAPLRTMEGFSGMALDDYGSSLPADGRRILERIQAGARRMGVLIDDLLAFSRLGRQELHKQRVQTTVLVSEVLAALTTTYPGRESTIHIGELPDCYGDYSLLRQVWTNLVSNALKYTSKTAVPRIEISCVESESEQVFSVRDNGAGFDMAYADKLFGVFQRLHHEREFEGTGVGLAITKRIVERHGGRVWAEGKENKGAVFFYALRKGGNER